MLVVGLRDALSGGSTRVLKSFLILHNFKSFLHLNTEYGIIEWTCEH